MLYAIGPAAVKMAGPAIFTTGQTHILGHLSQIHRFKNFFAEFFFFIGWMAAASGKLLIGSGGIVTNQAVNVNLGSKVKIFILPSIPGVAAGAPAPVRARGNSEAVENISFAQLVDLLLFLFAPGPMNGIVDLLGRLGMTGQTGLRHLRTTLKLLFKLLELPMVGSWFGHYFFNLNACGFIPGTGNSQTRQAENRKQTQNEKYFQQIFHFTTPPFS